MSSKSNKWSVPPIPPPLFVNEKERNFSKQIADEITEKIIGQPILYYPIDEVNTDFHSLYGESINKTFLPPIRVYVLLEWIDEGYESKDSFGEERRTACDVFFHKRRLSDDQNLFVRTGDFICYNQIYYEVTKLSEPRELFGQAEYKLEIQAHCIRARSGTFNAK